MARQALINAITWSFIVTAYTPIEAVAVASGIDVLTGMLRAVMFGAMVTNILLVGLILLKLICWGEYAAEQE